MLRYKIDVLAHLKQNGYTYARLLKEEKIGNLMLQKIRNGEMMSWQTLDKVCALLGLQPGDIIEHIDPQSDRFM